MATIPLRRDQNSRRSSPGMLPPKGKASLPVELLEELGLEVTKALHRS